MKVSRPCMREHFHLNKRAEGGRGGPRISGLSVHPKKAAGHFADWLSVSQGGKNELLAAWIPTLQGRWLFSPPKIKLSIRRDWQK